MLVFDDDIGCVDNYFYEFPQDIGYPKKVNLNGEFLLIGGGSEKEFNALELQIWGLE